MSDKAFTIENVGMMPCHPGEFFREEYVVELKLTPERAAAILCVSETVLNEFPSERSPCTPELALRLEKAFELNMEMMLNMQAWHDARTMRRRADEFAVERYEYA